MTQSNAGDGDCFCLYMELLISLTEWLKTKEYDEEKVMFAGDRSRSYKKNHIFKISGIDYAKVIATRVYDVSIRNTCRELVRCLLFDYIFLVNERNNNILVAYSYLGKGRSDFDGIVNDFCDCIDNKNDRIDFIYKITFKYFPVKLVRIITNYVRFLFARVDHPFYASVLTSQFIHYKGLMESKIDFKRYKLLVTFCDAHGVENMLTQLANNRGIKTATLQHGQYRVLKKETENADVESYENFISDYLLAWGSKTRDEFVKGGIEASRIIIVGALKAFTYNEKLPLHETLGTFGVVLDGNIYHSSNVLMIEYANYLAEKYNLKFVLRLHPKNDEDDYIPLCNKRYLIKTLSKVENKKYAEIVDFSLVHMTGVFVELLSINSPMFLMKDEFLEDIFAIPGASFSNENELSGIYEYFISNIRGFASVQYDLYRQFNEAGSLKQNYKNAVEKILGNAL